MPLTSTYSNNRSTPAQISNVGFKVSKPGYNALTTGGSNYSFDSSWPSLFIAYEKTFPNPFTGGVTTYTLNHNLKYPPLTFIWAYGPDLGGLGNVSMRFLMPVDSTAVKFDITVLTNYQQTFIQNASKIDVKCFNLDLSKDIDYTLAPGDTFKRPYDNSFGVKYVKQNKNISSTDLRDFTLHSRCQSPLVLAVKTQDTIVTTSPTVVQYQSKYTYPVWVYGFIKGSTGTYRYAPYYSQAYPRTSTDGFLSYLIYQSPDVGATLVILRDPMFASTQTTVQY